MHITGTMTQMETYFEEWHEEDFATLHSSLFNRIDAIESDKDTNIDNFKRKLLTLANLISFKLDGDVTQITNLENLNNITNKTEATAASINLKNFNEKLTQHNGLITTLQNLIGTNTTNNNNSIFSRLASLENSNLSTSNIDERISNFFEGTIIPTNSDLNTYKTPGIYKCIDDSVANGLRNKPINKAFSLIVLRHKNNSVRQIINEYDNNNIWVRNYRNVEQNWSDWTKLYGEHNTYTFPMEVEFSNSTKTYTIIATDIQ